jgi:uncharacterized protein (TIGR00369 family)
VAHRARYGKSSRRGANVGNGLDGVVNFTGGDTWVKSMRCLKVGGRPLPTMNFRVDYLRPAVNTGLTASARVRRAGRSFGVVDVDVFDARGSLVAIGRASCVTQSG